MRTGKVLFLLLGVTACTCWMIASAVADDQPGARGGKSAIDVAVQPQVINAKSAAPQQAGAAQITQRPGGTVMVTRDGKISPAMATTFDLDIPPDLGPRDDRANNCADNTSPGYLQWPTNSGCGNKVYCSEGAIASLYYTGHYPDSFFMEDVELAGTDKMVCELTLIMYSSAGPYNLYLSLWTDCLPSSAGGPGVQLGATQSKAMANGLQVATFLFNPDIFVPDNAPDNPPVGAAIDFWVALQQDVGEAGAVSIGPIIAACPATVEIGYSRPIFSLYGACNRSGSCATGGTDSGNILMRMFANTVYGACCDRRTGTCANNIAAQNCAQWYNQFHQDKACNQITCTAAIGACCDLTTPPGTCTNNVHWGDCRGANQKYADGASCSPDPFNPDCGTGACCTVLNGVYTCYDNYTQYNCEHGIGYTGSFVLYRWNQLCSDLLGCHPVPANDECANAIALSGTCLTVDFNTENASYTAASVPNDPPSCLTSAAPMINDIWYKYSIPSTYQGVTVTRGVVVISTLGSMYDTVVVAYGNEDDGGIGCPGGINCPVTSTQEVHILDSQTDLACSDDIEGGINQASYLQIGVSGDDNTMDVGGCLLIRVGGLDQASNPGGGAGKLNIDFFPTDGDGAWDSDSGVCCLYDGTCMYTSYGVCHGTEEPQIGYFRRLTDFYEYGAAYDPANTGDPVEGRAHFCCAAHGEWGSCQVGEYCGNPIKLSPPPTYTPYEGTWTGNVSKVTYFSFRTRTLVGAETGYAITLDTCGSAFNTVLSVYKGWESAGGPQGFSPYGECLEGNLIKRNNECTLAGGAGDVQGKQPVLCYPTTAGESCMCLTVGPLGGTQKDLEAGLVYYVAVGANETGMTRAMGTDPVVNYPRDPALALHLKIWQHGMTECTPCLYTCCKGDVNVDTKVDGNDIQLFTNYLFAPPSCSTAAWCAANMNSDLLVDYKDIPLFVSALLYGYGCTTGPSHCLPTDTDQARYCQAPDQSGRGCNNYVMSVVDEDWPNYGADNFLSPTGGLIDKVCWWGFGRLPDSWDACTGTGAPSGDFEIAYYEDDNGRPGKLYAGPYAVQATATSTGETVNSLAEFLFQASHPTVLVPPETCLWLELVHTTNTSCYFAWEVAPAGDDRCWNSYAQGQYQEGSGEVNDFDMAFCVNIEKYSNGCGNIGCNITCSGTTYEGQSPTSEAADCTTGFVDKNQGCSANTAADELFTPITMSNNQTLTICGHLGTYEGQLKCANSTECTSPATCVGGYCNDGLHTLRDTDWYDLNLTGAAKIALTVEVENQTIVYFTSDTANDTAPLCDSGDTFYGWDVSCTSGVCAIAGVPNTTTTYAVGHHIFAIFGGNWVVPCGTEYRITITTTP